MSQQKGAKGLNPDAQTKAEEKRKQEQMRIGFNPFKFSAVGMSWMGRRTP